MDICIVTVYNSINSGSYWQAMALKSYLENMGHNVYFLERRVTVTSSASRIFQMSSIFKKLLTGNFSAVKIQRRMYREFQHLSSNFNTISLEEISKNKIDCVILGSDTIWNLDSKYFSHEYLKFWGAVFPNTPVFSYAGSVANTSVDTLLKYKDLPEVVSSWTDISVRDAYSKELLNTIVPKKRIEIVGDPTLLLNNRDYGRLSVNRKMKPNFIFLYLFSKLTDSQIAELQRFAREKDLKIVSGVKYENYADRSIVNAPQSFLRYMLDAAYIVTDTFHGTIFSINFEKQFVSLDRNKKKVDQFLADVKLQDRLLPSDSLLIPTLNKRIDYGEASKIVEKLRIKSREFLTRNTQTVDWSVRK